MKTFMNGELLINYAQTKKKGNRPHDGNNRKQKPHCRETNRFKGNVRDKGREVFSTSNIPWKMTMTAIITIHNNKCTKTDRVENDKRPPTHAHIDQ